MKSQELSRGFWYETKQIPELPQQAHVTCRSTTGFDKDNISRIVLNIMYNNYPRVLLTYSQAVA